MAITNTPVKKISLVDVLDSNKTVRDNITKNNEGDIYTVNTKANDAANAYWEQYGATLYPDTQLVSPEEILKDKNAPVPVTAADLMGNTALSDEQALAETAYANTQTPEYLAGIQAQAGVDVNKAYESDVSRFQTDIDALDRAIVEKRTALSAQYDQIGRGRQGTATAIQARRGLLGSDMGEQYQSELTTQTQGEKNSAIALADAEYNSQKSSIRDKQLGLTQIIRKEQSDEAALRLSASKSGSQAKLDEIKNRKVRATEAIANIIQNALDGDIDLSKAESKQALDELAKTYGTTPKAIIAQYNQAISDQVEEANAQEAAAIKATKESYTTLSEGQKLVDAYGNTIAEGTGKRITLGYGDTLMDADGNIIQQMGDKPISELDAAEQVARIQKIQSDIDNASDPYIKAQKQADLEKTMAEINKLNNEANGTSAKGKILNATQTDLLAQGFSMGIETEKGKADTYIGIIGSLQGTLDKYKGKFGPVGGLAASKNPWDVDAQTVNATITAAAQTIGKYMEGGVLRQEDVAKYKVILPQISDPPAVAQAKIDNIKVLLKQKQNEYINTYGDAGYDVSKFGYVGAGSTADTSGSDEWGF